MKPDELFDAIGQIRDQYIEEAVAAEPKPKKNMGYAWAGLAAALVVMIIGWQMLLTGPSGPPTATITPPAGETSETVEQLPVIRIDGLVPPPQERPETDFHGVADQTGSPWSEADSITQLPIFAHLPVTRPVTEITPRQIEQMRRHLSDICRRLGMNYHDEAVEQHMEPAAEPGQSAYGWVRLSDENYTVTVLADLSNTIELFTPLVLPQNLKLTRSASYDEVSAAAEYIMQQRPDLIGLDDPRAAITSYGESDNQLSFYPAGKTAAENLINFNFSRVYFWPDQAGVKFIHTWQTDLSHELGDFPVLSPEEAKNRLYDGQYFTPEMPGLNPKLGQMESVELQYYRADPAGKLFIPVYRFLIRHPAGQSPGLLDKTNYYVPAVAESVLSDLARSLGDDQSAEGLPMERVGLLSEKPYQSDGPWQANQVISLPVYRDQLSQDGEVTLSVKRRQMMIDCLKQAADGLGMSWDESAIEYDLALNFERQVSFSQAVIRNDDYIISVDQDLVVLIMLNNPLELPPEVRLSDPSDVSQWHELADYLQANYGDIIGHGQSDYIIRSANQYQTKTAYQILFYPPGETLKDQLVNYQFRRVKFLGLDRHRIDSIRLSRSDLSDQVGDYPVISPGQAGRLLLAGQHLPTGLPEVAPESDISLVELTYRLSAPDNLWLPYYRFLVPLAEPSDYTDYGAYYVPAIESDYWQGPAE